MSIPERSAQPSRFTRTLPWLAGLMLGTAAHLVWWTSARAPERVVEVVTVPAASPDVHVHVHQATGDDKVHVHRRGEDAVTASRAAKAECRKRARAVRRHDLASARGAVVCGTHGCTIRRSFIERMLRDPSLLGPDTRVQGVQGPAGPQGLRVLGVYAGSLPDLLGLRNGDVITEIDGVPMRSASDLARIGSVLGERDGLALTLRRGELRQTLRYRVIDG
jgi:type II secretory pathway component PulC